MSRRHDNGVVQHGDVLVALKKGRDVLPTVRELLAHGLQKQVLPAVTTFASGITAFTARCCRGI